MTAVRCARDLNMEVAGSLYDLAFVHSSKHARVAYKRAARAVLALEQSVAENAKRGSLQEIPYIGPASERIILEHLEHGRSATVERAIEHSGKRAAVEAAHAFRTNFLSRAEVLRILRARASGVISLADYQGDLQMHTQWSDGGETIAEMAEAAMARGHSFLGVSDHSYGLRIARGMSMADAEKQRREIEGLNASWSARFRVFQGIEANILADGAIDLTPDEVARFEIVLAAPHSKLRRAEDQTDRMIAAIEHSGVHILAHPRGRMYSRQGVLARWDEVFAVAARREVAIELDGDFYRQDLDWSLARRAVGAGCLFALDSDAHAGDELIYSEYAVAHARLAGIPAERVINCWSAARLAAWTSERSRR